MKVFIAYIFKYLFKIPFLKKHYFGVRKRIFIPFKLFNGIVIQSTFKKNTLLELHIDDWIQEQLFFIDQYEEAELLFIKSILKKGSVFIDIGTNIGLHSLYASKLVGKNGSVISFEPFSKNFKLFKKNCTLNNSKNITPENKAISDKNERITLHYDSKESNLGMASSYINIYSESEQVSAVSIDSYLMNSNLSKIDFIKIDIEGGEYKALIGMKKTLEKFHPTLMIEILDNNLEAVNNNQLILKYLASLGYIKYYIDDFGKISKIEKNKSRLNYAFIFENSKSIL